MVGLELRFGNFPHKKSSNSTPEVDRLVPDVKYGPKCVSKHNSITRVNIKLQMITVYMKATNIMTNEFWKKRVTPHA